MTVETKQGSAIEAVQRLRPIIEHYRDEAERERRMPAAVVSAMKEEDLFKLWLPEEFGGQELDMPSYLEAIRELSRIDSAAGWMLANTGTGAIHAAFLPPAGAREVFGSDELTSGAITPRGRAAAADHRALPRRGGARAAHAGGGGQRDEGRGVVQAMAAPGVRRRGARHAVLPGDDP